MTSRRAPGGDRVSVAIFMLAALLALAVPASAPTLREPRAIPCATSRALGTIASVGEAMYFWRMDETSGLKSETPIEGRLGPGSPPVDVTQVPVISAEDLRALLVPLYIADIPEYDPWGKEYDYRLNVANPLSPRAIALRSAGADGLFEATTYGFVTTNGPEEDLVLYSTTLVRQPPRHDAVSRQLATAEAVQRLGDAMLSWLMDHALGLTMPPGGGDAVDLSQIAPISSTGLAALLTPSYTLHVPAQDGWGNALDLRLNADRLGSPVMSIRSPGADGLLEGDRYETGVFPANNFKRDLVWSDGTLIRGPSATATLLFTDGFESGALWGTWSCGPEF